MLATGVDSTSSWLQLCLAAGLAALSTLTLFKAPGLWGWKLSLLAGEFGYILSLLPIGLGVWIGVVGPERGALDWLALAFCAASGLLFLKPIWQAARVARDLPKRLEAAFGLVACRERPFALARLFRFRAPEARVHQHVYAEYGDGVCLRLDFYEARREPAADEATPCVIAIHGGGWDNGHRGQLEGFNHWLASRGFAVAAIEYRLAPGHRWPAQEEDVRRAVDYLKAHAGELGVDARRLFLFGRSAGGQIASAVGHRLGRPAIAGVVAFYAPHDMRFAWRYGKPGDALESLELLRRYLGGRPDEQPALYRDASAYCNMNTGGVPPTLLIHGRLDKLVWFQQSARFEQRLRDKGARALFLKLPWATHAFEVNLSGPSGQLARYAVERFLRSPAK